MNNAKLIYRYNDKISIVRVNSTLALLLNGTVVRPLGSLEETLAERCQTLTQERDAALEREAALAAALREAQCITANWYDNEEDIGECLNKMDHWAIKTMHPDRFRDCLTKRDLLQRAEELEALAEHFLVGESHKHFIKQRAHQLRQRAQELTTQ